MAFHFYATRPGIQELYSDLSTGRNSGFDLRTTEDILFPPGKVVFVNFGLSVHHTGGAFWMLPRSSISKTPLRMANSLGLIDADYRGDLIAALENTSDKEYVVLKGSRLVQIARADLAPFSILWSKDPHPMTSRGSGGFGSTGI
jgi:dUTP pyrophosphatase